MKKVCSIIAIILMLSLFLTCTLPSEIEIKGNPVLRFSASMDFSKVFSDKIIESVGDNYDIVECTRTQYQTFIIHIDLFSEEVASALGSLVGLTEGPDGITNPTNLPLVNDNSPPINFGDISNTLNGFKFKKIDGKLFIGGSKIVEELSIEITISDDGDSPYTMDKDDNFAFGASGFNNSWANLTALPNRGKAIDLTSLLNDGSNIGISYKVTLPQGRTFPAEWINNAEVQAELVVWLSLEFEADTGGTDLDLSEFMGEFQDDLFGRESADSEGSFISFFDAIKLTIEFSHGVFNGVDLDIVSNSPTPLVFPTQKIKGNKLEINFDEDTMEKINKEEYYPFAPKFKLNFEEGHILAIPRNFKSNYITLEAAIQIIIEMSEE